MAVSREIRVGDQVPVELTFYKDDGSILDLSGAVSLEFVFRKPDGTTITRVPSLITDGTDGKASYTLLSAEVNLAGMWKVQGIADLPVLGVKHSTIPPFEVHRNL